LRPDSASLLARLPHAHRRRARSKDRCRRLVSARATTVQSRSPSPTTWARKCRAPRTPAGPLPSSPLPLSLPSSLFFSPPPLALPAFSPHVSSLWCLFSSSSSIPSSCSSCFPSSFARRGRCLCPKPREPALPAFGGTNTSTRNGIVVQGFPLSSRLRPQAPRRTAAPEIRDRPQRPGYHAPRPVSPPTLFSNQTRTLLAGSELSPACPPTIRLRLLTLRLTCRAPSSLCARGRRLLAPSP